jgi:hypothetical protein
MILTLKPRLKREHLFQPRPLRKSLNPFRLGLLRPRYHPNRMWYRLLLQNPLLRQPRPRVRDKEAREIWREGQMERLLFF